LSVSWPIPIIIAAGGAGRRMAANKPSQMLVGISLIDRALNSASSMSDMVAIAVQQEPAWRVPDGVKLLYDDQIDIGPLSALSSALSLGAGLKSSHVLLIPCDMPFLPADLLSRLASHIDDAAVAMVKSQGRLHPICALWSVEALSALPNYAQNSRRSLIGFAELLGLIEVEWAVGAVDPFFNINTSDDLAHAGRLLASGAVSN
jgi:molybdenum cofactor guanylyltransferase